MRFHPEGYAHLHTLWYTLKDIMRRPLLLLTAACALVANVVLWLPLPHLVQAIAAFALAALLPGGLLVALFFGSSKHSRQETAGRTPSGHTALRSLETLEHVVYAVALGFTCLIVVMLCLVYLPGGLARWQLLLAFDLLIVLLLVAIIRRNSHSPIPLLPTPNHAGWLLFATLLLILGVAAFLRLTNIGYHEFHNDEARAVLRAAGIIQGFEDTLLLHKKGPTEILVPTVIYALTGRLTEASARFPFAIANLAGLLAIFLLGQQLFAKQKSRATAGTTAGLVAMLLLTFDGYFIGFARIVQYQSIVFLTSTLVVLILLKLLHKPQAIQRHLIFAAMLLATGLLSHYEAALVLLPALFLWAILLWRNPTQRLQILTVTGKSAVLGTLLLSLFYIPYVRHPQFGATYTYLIERRIGLSTGDAGDAIRGGGLFPYNNLADVFLRTTLYSTTYQVALLVLLTVAALFLLYRRNLGRTTAGLLTFALVAALSGAILTPDWFVVGRTDLTFLPFFAAIGLALTLPKVSVEERLLWIWFGALFLLALFFTLKPRTHVYVFFMPWVLLAGWAVAHIGRWIDRRWSYPTVLITGGTAAILLGLLFGNYAYRYFVQNQPEVLRTWEKNRPAGYWASYDQPDKRALFGFPSNNGWKTIGALYNQGTLSGSYNTNELEAWGPSWYTRGAERCRLAADWYFQTTGNLEPFYDFQRVAMEDYLSKGFQPWGAVEVNGVRKMTIHKRTDEPVSELQIFRAEDYTDSFHALAQPTLPLTYPAVNEPIENPLHVNMADLLWLEGYNIDYERPLVPGGIIDLTLFWRAQQATDQTYKVFIQSFYGNGTMVAQRDTYPVCGNRDTWQWDPGELITDKHTIPIKEDAPDGLYPLFAGMYLEQTGSRLDVLDDEGTVIGDWIHLTDIRIGVE